MRVVALEAQLDAVIVKRFFANKLSLGYVRNKSQTDFSCEIGTLI